MFRKKYGINVNDLNEDDHEALVFMDILERKDPSLKHESETIRNLVVKRYFDLRN